MYWEQGIPVYPGNSEAHPGAFILLFVKYCFLIELKSTKDLGQEQRLYLRPVIIISRSIRWYCMTLCTLFRRPMINKNGVHAFKVSNGMCSLCLMHVNTKQCSLGWRREVTNRWHCSIFCLHQHVKWNSKTQWFVYFPGNTEYDRILKRESNKSDILY